MSGDWKNEEECRTILIRHSRFSRFSLYFRFPIDVATNPPVPRVLIMRQQNKSRDLLFTKKNWTGFQAIPENLLK